MKENFFKYDKFYSDFDDLLSELEIDELEDAKNLPDDYSIECHESRKEPIVRLDAAWILERIDEERFPEEDNDRTSSKIAKILKEHIDFDKINSLMPELYYEDRKKFVITKQDIINYVQ